MNFKELWLRGEAAQSDAINVQRLYIDINEGRLIDGVLFSQIMYWHGYDKHGKLRLRVNKDGEHWLAKRYEDWWEECRIKEPTARKAIDRMVKLGLLVKAIYKFNGAPTVHIRVNWSIFEKRIKSIWDDRSDENDTRGQKEMIPEDRTLTETTTETTAEGKETPPPVPSDPPPTDFDIIQSAIKDACKVAITDKNKGSLLKATRDAQNTGKTPEQIKQFGKWFNEKYWQGKWPNIGQIASDWPKFEAASPNGNGSKKKEHIPIPIYNTITGELVGTK